MAIHVLFPFVVETNLRCWQLLNCMQEEIIIYLLTMINIFPFGVLTSKVVVFRWTGN